MSAPTARKPRKPRTTHAVKVMDNFEPIELPALTASSLTDTVCLFVIDGREFHVPAKPRAVLAIRYLRDLRRKGADHATAALLEGLLGPDGLDGLCEYEDLTQDQFKDIMQAAQRLTMGAMEDEGNSSGSDK